MSNKLRLYWSSSLKAGRKNFGDWLSPLLCQHLSGREVIHTPPNQCDLVAIGSILQRVKHHFWNRRIHVWGTGFIAEQEPVKARHHYHAVRGKETARLVKGIEVEAFGDPGLLVDLLLPNHKDITKRYKVGIIPHYKDQTNPAVKSIVESLGNVKVLDVFSETYQLLHQIASCESILSSSMHGLIAADAFNIPNAWIKLSDSVRGEDFKFRDYYSVFDIDPVPLSPMDIDPDIIKKLINEYRRDNISQIKQSLLDAFPYPLSHQTKNEQK
jgi:hypothetical protein